MTAEMIAKLKTLAARQVWADEENFNGAIRSEEHTSELQSH